MRLKKSPKEALLQIDCLVKEGSKILDWIRGEDWDSFRNPISFGDYLDEQEEIETSDPQEPEFVANEIEFWNKKAIKELREIFMDESPIYKFRDAIGYIFDKREHKKEYIKLENGLVSKISILVNYYEQLHSLVSSPLVYITEKAQIWFYDFVVQLEPDSNEASLCGFMFNFGIGELKEFEDIYAHVKGESIEESDQWPKNWKAMLNNAYDGINKKANKTLGFNILSKTKNQLSISFPNRFIKGSS